METNELMLFANAPDSLALYVTFRTKMKQMFPDVEIKAAKTQITFKERHGFTFVSLPRRKKDLGAIIVSFGLPEKIESTRIWQAPEPYPNRWTHHVILMSETELDAELIGWLREAHAFALQK